MYYANNKFSSWNTNIMNNIASCVSSVPCVLNRMAIANDHAKKYSCVYCSASIAYGKHITP